MKKSSLAVFASLALCLLATPTFSPAQQPGGASLLTGGGTAALGPNSLGITSVTTSFPKTPEYNTQANDSQNKRYTLGTWLQVEVEFTSAVRVPEINFHYNILVGGALLTGDQTLVDVNAGRNLFTTVFVSPRTMTTLMRGQPLTVNSVQNIEVQILRQGVAQPLARKMMRETPLIAPTLQQVPGFVLNKAQTPFAPLWYDHYEAIKDPPAGR